MQETPTKVPTTIVFAKRRAVRSRAICIIIVYRLIATCQGTLTPSHPEIHIVKRSTFVDTEDRRTDKRPEIGCASVMPRSSACGTGNVLIGGSIEIGTRVLRRVEDENVALKAVEALLLSFSLLEIARRAAICVTAATDKNGTRKAGGLAQIPHPHAVNSSIRKWLMPTEREV